MRFLVSKSDLYSSFDLFPSMLSAFDLSGFVVLANDKPLSKGLEHDIAQLNQDQAYLFEDYLKAYERVLKEVEKLSKEKK